MFESNRLTSYISRYLPIVQRKINKHNRKLRTVQTRELSYLKKEKNVSFSINSNESKLRKYVKGE